MSAGAANRDAGVDETNHRCSSERGRRLLRPRRGLEAVGGNDPGQSGRRTVSGVPTGEHSRHSDDLCVAKVFTTDSGPAPRAQPLLRRRLVLRLSHSAPRRRQPRCQGSPVTASTISRDRGKHQPIPNRQTSAVLTHTCRWAGKGSNLRPRDYEGRSTRPLTTVDDRLCAGSRFAIPPTTAEDR